MERGQCFDLSRSPLAPLNLARARGLQVKVKNTGTFTHTGLEHNPFIIWRVAKSSMDAVVLVPDISRWTQHTMLLEYETEAL